MAQKTDLNVTPYYDDFDETDQFHKVLFRPGFAVQARELTQLQSILQNQIERFGNHVFKEGTIVIPGNISYDDRYFAVKLQASYNSVATNTYLANFVGTNITGNTSGVTAKVVGYAVTSGDDPDTLYVKYTVTNTTDYNDYLDLTSNSDFDDINYAIIETESALISEVIVTA